MAAVTLMSVVIFASTGCEKKATLAGVLWSTTEKDWEKICPDYESDLSGKTCNKIEKFDGIDVNLRVVWDSYGILKSVSYIPVNKNEKDKLSKAAFARMRRNKDCEVGEIGITLAGEHCEISGGVFVAVPYDTRIASYTYLRESPF